MTVLPTQDRVFIRPVHKAASPGGIALPGRLGEEENQGIVIATGPDCKLTYMDVILYPEVLATPVEVNGEKLRVVRERDVLAVIED